MNSSCGTAQWGKTQPNNPHNTPLVPKGSDFHSVCGLALPMNRFFISLPCSICWVPCTLNCTIKGSWRISKGYALSLASKEWNNVDTE